MSEQKKQPEIPLILKQNRSKAVQKGPVPYRHGSDTYERYSNRKNPFIERVLASEAEPTQMAPQKAQALFQHIRDKKQYQLGFTTERSPYNRRKIAHPGGGASQETRFVSAETLKEDSGKLSPSIETFFKHILGRLQHDPNELSLIVNELVPLFVEHEIRIKVYDAFRTFYSIDQFLETLAKISLDSEIENFELFCSALFGFYSQLQ